LVLEKNANFLQKIAVNCDHNIDPWGEAYMKGGDLSGPEVSFIDSPLGANFDPLGVKTSFAPRFFS
jgi:hypothetical protein